MPLKFEFVVISACKFIFFHQNKPNALKLSVARISRTYTLKSSNENGFKSTKDGYSCISLACAKTSCFYLGLFTEPHR